MGYMARARAEVEAENWGVWGEAHKQGTLTGQGDWYATSRCANSPGNEGQECPQDVEVIDEEEEIIGGLRGHSFQLLRVSVLDA